MSIREQGDDSAGSQAEVLNLRLGEPVASIRERLQQDRASTTVSKAEARTMLRSG